MSNVDAVLTSPKASFTEKLLLHNGLSISPLKGSQIDQSNDTRSLREAVSAIDNDNDLNQYIASYASKVPAKLAEIKYERNPVSTFKLSLYAEKN
jgi:hypothetical protein